MSTTLYDTKPWKDYRSHVLADDAECAFAQLAGNCRGHLHVHHVAPLAEGGPAFPENDGVVVLCASHHAWLHAWRRRKEQEWKRCPHHHRNAESRRQCEERRNRQVAA